MGRKKLPPENPALRKLSDQIAERLFTDGVRNRARRLVMEFHIEGELLASNAGWSERAVSDQIYRALDHALVEGVIEAKAKS